MQITLTDIAACNEIFHEASERILKSYGRTWPMKSALKHAMVCQTEQLSRILLERFNDENINKTFDLKHELLDKYDEDFKSSFKFCKDVLKVNLKEPTLDDIDMLNDNMYRSLEFKYQYNPSASLIIYAYIEAMIRIRIMKLFDDFSKIGITSGLNVFSGYRAKNISTIIIASNYKGPFNDEEHKRMESLRELLIAVLKSPILNFGNDFMETNVHALHVGESGYINGIEKKFYHFKIVMSSRVHDTFADTLINLLDEFNIYNGFHSKIPSKGTEELESWFNESVSTESIMKHREEYINKQKEMYDGLIEILESNIKERKSDRYDLFKEFTDAERKDLTKYPKRCVKEKVVLKYDEEVGDHEEKANIKCVDEDEYEWCYVEDEYEWCYEYEWYYEEDSDE